MFVNRKRPNKENIESLNFIQKKVMKRDSFEKILHL
jgi:hypothetical protein